MPKLSLSVVILTFNEEIHIQRALDSVSAFASKIYVVDSYSNDSTVSIAENFGAVVVKNRFVSQSDQFRWALDVLDIKTEWVMRLDADEIVSPALVNELMISLPNLKPDVSGILLKRKHIFMDRWIRFGGRYPIVLLRIWRNGKASVEDRWMDEHIVLASGIAVLFAESFSDYNLNDLSFFIQKHNQYATREAIDVLSKRLQLFPQSIAMNASGASFRTVVKRNIKELVYNRLPFPIASFMYFSWRYFFLLGFLDGRRGLVYHFLQGYWYRFLVGAKLLELEYAISHLVDKQEIKLELSRLTGCELELFGENGNT